MWSSLALHFVRRPARLCVPRCSRLGSTGSWTWRGNRSCRTWAGRCRARGTCGCPRTPPGGSRAGRWGWSRPSGDPFPLPLARCRFYLHDGIVRIMNGIIIQQMWNLPTSAVSSVISSRMFKAFCPVHGVYIAEKSHMLRACTTMKIIAHNCPKLWATSQKVTQGSN